VDLARQLTNPTRTHNPKDPRTRTRELQSGKSPTAGRQAEESNRPTRVASRAESKAESKLDKEPGMMNVEGCWEAGS